jgi:hypothetical protein
MDLLCRLAGLKMVRRCRDVDGEAFIPEIPNLDWVLYLMQQA